MSDEPESASAASASEPSSRGDEPSRLAALAGWVRDIPDFPRPGIRFRDLTPLLGHGPAFRDCVDLLRARVTAHRPTVVVAVESRGFLFGAPVAAALGLGLAPVRKPGKLPARVLSCSYNLEYGTDSLEMHADAVVPGARVVIVDDVLATGGTAEATAQLVRQQGGLVVGFCFVIELKELAGRARLADASVESLIVY